MQLTALKGRTSSLLLLCPYIIIYWEWGKLGGKKRSSWPQTCLITTTVRGGEKSSIHKHRLWNKHHCLCLIWINFWLNPTFHCTHRKCNLRILSLTSVVCHSSGILQSVSLSRLGVSTWPLRHVQSRSMRGHVCWVCAPCISHLHRILWSGCPSPFCLGAPFLWGPVALQGIFTSLLPAVTGPTVLSSPS